MDDQRWAKSLSVRDGEVRLTKRLTEMHDQLGGYGQLIGLLAIGPMAREQSKHSTELFATEVMLMMRHPGAL